MNAFEHVPPLPHPLSWIRNHSRRRYEIWNRLDLARDGGKPIAVISDESIEKTKKDIREALENFVSSLSERGALL